ncbi:interferon regulatory factor 7-like [Pyxicephalus adspersus]|uniref:interferon regulatory factor 7-like n=1 Tax=Pyxicephalus adspersus TaxID=30357 RepID=UPI003B5C04CD
MPVRERTHNRELFGPWLLRQITSNQYEGVYWLDDRRTLFRLPWKHLNIRNVDEKDYAIFKAWAIQSGRYNPLCEDLPTYKTNFRCALRAVLYENRRMFSEFNDFSSDPHDPHKIYRFHGAHDDSAVVNPSTVSQSGTEDENFHNEIEHDKDYRLKISPIEERTTPFREKQESEDIEQLLRNVLLDSSENDAQQVLEIIQDDFSQNIPRVDQIFREPVHEPNLYLAEPCFNGHEQPLPNNHSQLFHEQCSQYQRYDLYANGHIGNIPTANQVYQQESACSHLQPAEPVTDLVEHLFEGQSCHYVFHQEGTHHMVNNEATMHSPNYAYSTHGEMSAMQPPQNTTPSTFNEHGSTASREAAASEAHQASKVPKLTSWEVTVSYRGKEVLKKTVSTKFYINYTGHVPPTEAADIVTFPSTSDTLVDQLHISYTDKILNSVGNGLELDVSPHDCKLYATRMGNSRVYWSMSESLENKKNVSQAKKLDRYVSTEIFDFNHFMQELADYKCHQRASPDYTIYLSFGQILFEPIKKTLVLVKLVPHFCTFCHQTAQQEGASSLHNELISLQISNGSSFNTYDAPCLMDLDLSEFPDLF